MDYKTARNFLMDQGTALITQRNPDDLLMRLKQGKAPVPGQLTSILLALKIAFDILQGEENLDRQLVYALHLLCFESRQQYEAGVRAGVEWPPLLNEDLGRIAIAVRSIFCGTWQ
ncbi:MAG TPA: Dethiobiotin synthetase [Leptolyngbyaceae cyanobacterium]